MRTEAHVQVAGHVLCARTFQQPTLGRHQARPEQDTYLVLMILITCKEVEPLVLRLCVLSGDLQVTQKVLVAHLYPLFATLQTVARQAPLSMGFSRQEYWSGSPWPPGHLPNPVIEPGSPALQTLITEPPGKRQNLA